MDKKYDRYVQCPYYRKNCKMGIVCEGIAEKSSLSLTFCNRLRANRHSQTYCRGAWKTCPVATMHNRRYDYTP